ncbi:MAG: imidazole glycerol phosphate synthase subunit HisF [Actinobacteria bacterium]|uniref:imidazole glycerol-phosphate synthase n=1 Tax=freshwater metagenome TaxID=449393 RepID=A0A6J6H7L5_9ZZZZ|nr:imidazole glycerol phosphate synthase subunit HisF [Actinomycetota bacterium]MTA29698.1 imidazole glycerol phosphate synthase subunit HisF [Actinomycetota bacterium]
MSLTIRVIPCLDVADGRVVKGVNFENLRDAGDPIELADHYYKNGADELTFLDVKATVENRATMYDLVTKTAEQVFIPLTVGGGVRSVDDVGKLLSAGADKVAVSSAAIDRPSLLAEISNKFGNQVLVLSLDLKSRQGTNNSWIVTTHGGRVETDIDAIEWLAKAEDLGVGELLVNSIDADGTKEGFDVDLIAAVRSASRLPLIASGGAGAASDFPKAASAGADAILAASVFHNRSVTITETKDRLREAGFAVR